MSYRSLKRKLKRYRHRHQAYHPGVFRALDILLEGSKLLMLAAVFAVIFYAM